MSSTHCRECGTELPPAPSAGFDDLFQSPDQEKFAELDADAGAVDAPQSSTPPTLPFARRTAGHPVADNPIRLLAGEGWTTPRDLVKNARRLKLMARESSIEPEEPGRQICPRLRAQEDYVAAEKQVTDAVQFATAAAFVPDDWAAPVTESGKANLLLLEAEHLPQGDGRKAELVDRAIRCWDSEAGMAAIRAACTQADKLFNAAVEVTEVQHRVGKALCSVAEQVISDFGESIEVSEIELLNTLDGCQRLPEARGAAAAGDLVILKQQERIDRYLNEAGAVLNSGKVSAQGFISDAEIQRLVAGCKEARQAFTLLQRRPALLHRLPEDRKMHVSTVSVALAFQLGWHSLKWAEAAELASGIHPENINPNIDPQTRRLFMVCCRAIPLMARVARGNDMNNEIAALQRIFPHCLPEIHAFKMQALQMLGRGPGVVRPVAAGGESDGNSGAGWLVGFIIFGLLFAARNCNRQESKSSWQSYQPPPPSHTYDVPKPRRAFLPVKPPKAVLTDTNRLDRESLTASETQVSNLLVELKRLKLELGRDEFLVNRTDSRSVEAFNARVADYNQKVAQARVEEAAFNAAVKAYNQSLTNHVP